MKYIDVALLMKKSFGCIIAGIYSVRKFTNIYIYVLFPKINVSFKTIVNFYRCFAVSCHCD